MTRNVPCLALVLALSSAAVTAQAPSDGGAPRTADGEVILNAEDEVHRQARIAVTGDLGFAPLPPVTASSPKDSIYWADRVPVGQGPVNATGGTPTITDLFIPSGAGGTGTAYPEIAKYQVPTRYNPTVSHPLLVAMHGFGFSASSVASQSTLDEECEARSWFYLAPTGIDDQLFGPPVAQENIAAAIQYMIDNYNIDEDRIYMVGFSMGGGIVANFAARYRDPDGIMIAAVGTVSATLDWVQEYNLGNASLQTLLEHPVNFMGSPAQFPFKYHQASGMYFTGYPPLPGVADSLVSMATNLAGLPVYITYDSGDTIPNVTGVNEELEALLVARGSPVMKTVVTGTVNPDFPWIPAPHSWAVLDESEMCDMFAAVSVDRRPADFEAQQDLGGPASWIHTTQSRTDEFTYVTGSVDTGTGTITLTDIDNAETLTIDVGAAGITSYPVRMTATSVDALTATEITLTNLPLPPSYLLDVATSQLITIVDSDPATGSLIVDVAPQRTLDVDVIHDPRWTTTLTSSPNPVPIGTSTLVSIDAPATSANVWWIFGVQELLLTVKTMTITANPAPPALLVFLPLDSNGDISFNVGIPNDPLLQDARLVWQTLSLDATNKADSVSNLWGFRIQ